MLWERGRCWESGDGLRCSPLLQGGKAGCMGKSRQHVPATPGGLLPAARDRRVSPCAAVPASPGCLLPAGLTWPSALGQGRAATSPSLRLALVGGNMHQFMDDKTPLKIPAAKGCWLHQQRGTSAHETAPRPPSPSAGGLRVHPSPVRPTYARGSTGPRGGRMPARAPV